MSKNASHKRWSAKRKQEVVLRRLCGKSLDVLSRKRGEDIASHNDIFKLADRLKATARKYVDA